VNWLKAIAELVALIIPPLRRVLDQPSADEIDAAHDDALGDALDAADRKPSRPARDDPHWDL
jgi:hypothetical protein